MSLAIQTADITAVLLTDGWHPVTPGTFDLDSYEYLEDDQLLHGGGHSGVCATGFTFQAEDTNQRITGPLTAIQAVRHAA